MWVKSVHAHTISEVDSAIATQVNLKNGAQKYTVDLPHALSAQIDLKLTKGFYLNLPGYFPLNNSGTASSIRATRTFAITPRWENKWFGIYVPLSFNQFHDTNLGAAIRLGPLYFGSANLGSVLFNKDMKAADFHLGIRIPVGFGKPGRALRVFDNIADRKPDSLPQPFENRMDRLQRRLDRLQDERGRLSLQNERVKKLYQRKKYTNSYPLRNGNPKSARNNRITIVPVPIINNSNKDNATQLDTTPLQYVLDTAHIHDSLFIRDTVGLKKDTAGYPAFPESRFYLKIVSSTQAKCPSFYKNIFLPR